MGDGRPIKSLNCGCNETNGHSIFWNEQRSETPGSASAPKANGPAAHSCAGNGGVGGTSPGIRLVDDPDLSHHRAGAGGAARAQNPKLPRSPPGNQAPHVDAGACS